MSGNGDFVAVCENEIEVRSPQLRRLVHDGIGDISDISCRGQVQRQYLEFGNVSPRIVSLHRNGDRRRTRIFVIGIPDSGRDVIVGIENISLRVAAVIYVGYAHPERRGRG